MQQNVQTLIIQKLDDEQLEASGFQFQEFQEVIF